MNKVTWIMPVRNGMPYLPETLASIEVQTGVPARILVWDNGSTDGTIEELQRWIPSRIPGRVVVDRPQATLAESLDLLVREADTEYCARIDADDICLPGRLETQVAFLDANPSTSLVGGQVEYIDPEGETGPFQQPLPTRGKEILPGLLHGCPICHPTWVFRREDILEVGNYNQQTPEREDVDLLIRLVVHEKKVSALSERVLRYRVHPNSFTQTNLRNDHYALVPVQSLALHAETFLGLHPRDVTTTLADKQGFKLLQYRRILKALNKRLPASERLSLCSVPFLRAMHSLCGNKRPARAATLKAVLAGRKGEWDVCRNQAKMAVKHTFT